MPNCIVCGRGVTQCACRFFMEVDGVIVRYVGSVAATGGDTIKTPDTNWDAELKKLVEEER